MNICEHLTRTSRIFPRNVAIRFEGVSYTYERLDQMSSMASESLLNAGVQPGDRVALMLSNVPAFFVWYYAAMRIGAIVVSISTRSAIPEAVGLLEDCSTKCLVTNKDRQLALKGKMPGSVTATIATSDVGDECNGQTLSQHENRNRTWFEASPDDPAVILYTSGTTGYSKGATLSHRNVHSNVCAFNHLCGMQPHDRMLLAVPLFHCFGQNALMNSALNVGATLVLQRAFDLNETKRLIREERVTQLYGVPMMFQLLLKRCEPGDLDPVNYCFSAAATLPLQVSQQWQEKFDMPINEGYGLTETSPFASYNHRLHFVPGSIGTPIDSVEMKVVDTETGETCPNGELGEIAIRGPNVMLGYWNRDAETEKVLRDGWFHSGDVGRVDEAGYFSIVDRVKDMITVGGLKVFPAEVERVLRNHSAVKDVAVVGIEEKVFGEQVVAFVVLEDHAEARSHALPLIEEYAREQLANYKVPRIIVQIDELPRNPSGKVLKRELRGDRFREMIAMQRQGDELSVANAPRTSRSQLREPFLRQRLVETHKNQHLRVAEAYLLELVQMISGQEQLPDATSSFLDLGLDSLSLVEISNQVQMELGPDFEVPVTLVFDHPRICDLSKFLVAAMTDIDFGQSRKHLQDEETNEARHINHQDNLRQQISAMSEDEALAELMKELGSGSLDS
ncbi:MAG: AMP-binding protein [Planctomycetaceae bacterium]|nr:AMP-binding protein [Planctomycetaceae bacterium]